jgi:hypothetical protein
VTNLAFLGGFGLEPDVPDVSEVLDDVVLHVGSTVVLGLLPPGANVIKIRR